jgi:hypothetical protein
MPSEGVKRIFGASGAALKLRDYLHKKKIKKKNGKYRTESKPMVLLDKHG